MRQPDRRRGCARRPGSPGECAGSHCRFSTACRQCPPPPRQLLRGRFWTLLALGVLSDSPWKRGAQPLRGQAHAPHGRAGEHPALRSPICTILRPDLLIVAFLASFLCGFTHSAPALCCLYQFPLHTSLGHVRGPLQVPLARSPASCSGHSSVEGQARQSLRAGLPVRPQPWDSLSET